MQITLELPENLVQNLAPDVEGLSRFALEALALEGIRSGKLTVYQARCLLGIRSRYEMDGFLKAHEMYLPLTLEDIQKESDATLDPSA